MPRILGDIDQGRPGPTFLAQGGIHGNEPAGVRALERVLAWLKRDDVPIHGRFVACAGNLQALAQGRRFLERDLNRGWTAEALARTRDVRHPNTAEDVEQTALIELYEQVDRDRGGPLVFTDLHTSSADGPPFTCMADTVPNRRVADAIPVPMILGLEECIEGAVMDWFNQRGQIGLAVEGGRHDADETVDNLESAVLLTMAATGVVPEAAVDVAFHRQRLDRAAKGAPHLVEITHRQAITPADRFVMTPGYVSFQPITADELLAHDVNGEVRAERDGYVLLPLYQGQGEDGFFLGRRVPRFWFALSPWFRRFHVGALLPLLPGIRRVPGDPDTLEADPAVARWLVVEIFHLCGFRRRRKTPDGKLRFTRRRAEPECWKVGPRR